MRNPGIFIAAPASTSRQQLTALKRALSHIALERGYAAYRGQQRGSIFRLLAAIVAGEIVLVKNNTDASAASASRDIADVSERAREE